VKAIVGPNVKVRVEHTQAPGADKLPYFVKDEPKFVVKMAGANNLTLFTLDTVVDALKEVASDEPGKKALTQNLKEVLIYSVAGNAQYEYKDGTLMIATHVFGDGEGSSVDRAGAAELLNWGMTLDEPLVGGKMPLGYVRAVHQLESGEVTALREGIKKIVGAPVEVAASYAMPGSDKSPEAVMKWGKTLARWGDKKLKYSVSDQLLRALTDVAASPSKAALQSRLKKVNVVVLTEEPMFALKDSVLTVGASDNSGWDASGMRKDLEAALK
jgi:hypothetical protein